MYECSILINPVPNAPAIFKITDNVGWVSVYRSDMETPSSVIVSKSLMDREQCMREMISVCDQLENKGISWARREVKHVILDEQPYQPTFDEVMVQVKKYREDAKQEILWSPQATLKLIVSLETIVNAQRDVITVHELRTGNAAVPHGL